LKQATNDFLREATGGVPIKRGKDRKMRKMREKKKKEKKEKKIDTG
jgi:hypothetical protein